ncbi:MAG: hypothetical protein CYPHOPRED_005090 [Cyphobasidiales sp. Tagirdzhanova-0007]|nr:MAG: hypothetical protein CYPHOPRED_005090 [Cyphobasidiales sp. Tagirdzhanova-0007]
MDAFRLPLSDATNTNHAYLPAKLRYKHSQTERSQKDPYHVPRRAGSSAIFPASWSPLCSPLPSSSAASSSPIRAGCRENSLVFQSSSPACLRPSSPPASPASHIKTSSNIAIAADGQKTNLQASVLDIVSLCDRVDIVTGETLHIGRKTEAMPFASARDQHIKRVQLPKAAKHASRHHCSVKTLISPENSRLEMHLDVLGQNGMQWEGIKIAKGLVIVEVKPDQEARLGFFSGFEIILKIHSASTTPVGKTAHNSFDLESESSCQDGAAPSSDMIQNTASSVTSLPSVTSSPLSSVVSSPAGDCDGARPNKRRRLFSLPKSHVESSGQSPSPYAHQDDDGYPPESSDEEDGTDAMGKFAASQLEASHRQVKDAVQTLSLDVIGYISSSMVFQPRATLTTSECTSLLLAAQPSLQEYGDIEAWLPCTLNALQTGPFESIANKGLKDAAGKPLETSWHYSPSLDTDPQRRQSLAPFVKSVRSACRHRAQYYFKPISDLKKKRW